MNRKGRLHKQAATTVIIVVGVLCASPQLCLHVH